MEKKLFGIKNCIVVLLFVCMFFTPLFSDNPAQYRTTALRFIDSAKNCFVHADYENAVSQAAAGLTYDDSVADLYYIQALALSVQEAPAYMITPLLRNSLSRTWYAYNRDAARLLLADLYTRTGRSADALSLLDETPQLNDSQALCTRAKALYILGDINQARSVLEKGALQYPSEADFVRLFFNFEQTVSAKTSSSADTDKQKNAIDKRFNELAGFFVTRSKQLGETETDLLLKAAAFAVQSDEKVRLLKEWNAYGKSDPWYGVYALENGLLDETEAFEYELPFLSGVMDYTCVKAFLSLIRDQSVKERIQNFYASYEGTISFDTDKDTVADLFAVYRYGRPQRIECDSEQNGRISWAADCDYGSPVKIVLFDFENTNLTLWYGIWPAVARAVVANDSIVYDLTADRVYWSPFQIIRDPLFEANGGSSLYIPVLTQMQTRFPLESLFENSYAVERNTEEYSNSRVRLSIAQGRIQNAVYTENGTPYAYAHFENGVLMFRNVDRDKNGTYEITELYGFNEEQAQKYRSAEEEAKLSAVLFGFNDMAKGLFLQKTVSDTAGSSGEYIEEYGASGSYSVTWKDASAAGWDVFYERIDGLTEQITYTQPFSKTRVQVDLKNGIPVSVNGRPVIKDPDENFFWLDVYPGPSYAKKIKEMLNRKGGSGVIVTTTQSMWLKEQDRFFRIFGVKSGDAYFGEVIYE